MTSAGAAPLYRAAVRALLGVATLVGPAPKAAVVDAQTGRVYVPSQIDDLVRVIQP